MGPHDYVASLSELEVRKLASRTSLDLAVLAAVDVTAIRVLAHLARTGSEEIAEQLAMNNAASTSILDTVADRFTALQTLVGRHENARPDLKERLPIGDLSDLSVAVYLEDNQADDDLRRTVARALQKSPRPGGPLLGDVARAAK